MTPYSWQVGTNLWRKLPYQCPEQIMMGAASSSKTLVPIFHNTKHHIPGGNDLQIFINKKTKNISYALKLRNADLNIQFIF
jgi:hypothetical protein